MPTSGSDRAPETRSSAGREPGGTPISSRALSQVLPNAELRQLEGVSHNVKMNVLAPVLADFFTREADIAVGGKEGRDGIGEWLGTTGAPVRVFSTSLPTRR
jgi:hypothetical protein